MNLQRPNANEATRTVNRSRSVSPSSGICTRCLDGCTGNCEVFKATFRGRELIYPGPFGEITAGNDKDYPIDYSHLNIQGYAMGAKGLPKGVKGDSDTALFPSVNTETEYGWTKKVKMKIPVFTGALGSTEIARKNWEHFAVGAALSGVTLVCGENVCGIDPKLERDSKGKVTAAPDMDRRIEIYKKYHQGYGEILVQMNVEDTRLGVAEYVAKKHGLDTIELKWGQGAKCIGGEIKVNSLERALELQKRGYIVTPDPTDPVNQAAYKDGAIKEFERHSRLGFIDEEGFYKEVDRLRKIGFKRITLKTGAYGLRELAMALKKRDVTIGAQIEHNSLDLESNTVGIGVSIPLMTGYAYEGEVARAESEYQAALLELDHAHAYAISEINKARGDLKTAEARVTHYDDNLLKEADKVLQSAEFAYKQGAQSVMDLLDARRTYKATQIEAASARADYASALAAWQFLSNESDRP